MVLLESAHQIVNFSHCGLRWIPYVSMGNKILWNFIFIVFLLSFQNLHVEFNCKKTFLVWQGLTFRKNLGASWPLSFHLSHQKKYLSEKCDKLIASEKNWSQC